MDESSPPVLFAAMAGLVGGIVLFMRGLVAYRRDRLISSVATSSLDGIAAGEVRVSGVVEAIDHVLTSPLQSKPCVWYRARVEESGDDRRVLLAEERAVQFRIAHGQGAIRVVPNGARWEVEADFDESTDLLGSEPAGLQRRSGSSVALVLPDDPEQMSEAQRQAAAEDLLTVRPPAESTTSAAWSTGDRTPGFGLGAGQGRRYKEARLEPGETVTVIGQALPWSDVREHLLESSNGSNEERAIADDIASARAAGLLVASPDEAWGNAAIPGFGIGRPTQRPELDPDARVPQVAGADAHEHALERYVIPDGSLVLARGPGGVMAIYRGEPTVATQHHDFAFLMGLAGAVVSVLCALALGIILTGRL